MKLRVMSNGKSLVQTLHCPPGLVFSAVSLLHQANPPWYLEKPWLIPLLELRALGVSTHHDLRRALAIVPVKSRNYTLFL